jgi:hypothetical protein
VPFFVAEYFVSMDPLGDERKQMKGAIHYFLGQFFND